MIRRTAIVMLALALLTVGGAGAAPDFASFQVQPFQPPKPAPAFALPSLDGRTVRLEDLQGKLVPIFSGPLGDPIAGRSYLPSIGCTESSRARAWRSCW